jgi:transcriptional regulator with XRE-family HTH domain
MPQKSFDEKLGRYLADYRRGLSISQEYLAEILRRDQTFVSKVETGKRALSVFEFIRWARALNIAHQEILTILTKLESHAE